VRRLEYDTSDTYWASAGPRILSYTWLAHRNNVQRFVGAVVGVNLQKVSDLLCSAECWAYAIAFDGATVNSRSFLDVRVRFSANGNTENIHLLAIPLHGSHTSEAMANFVGNLLSVLCGAAWKNKLVIACTDGARNMTGKVNGVVIRLSVATLQGFFRVWCTEHQLDLEIQQVMSQVLSESFYQTLTGLISHLRRQVMLIMEMRSTCPTVVSTRWHSLGRVCEWLVKNRAAVLDHLEKTKLPCAPYPAWWVLLVAVEAYKEPVDTCFTKLQGHTTIIGEQDGHLQNLVSALRAMLHLDGPLSASDVFAKRKEDISGRLILGKLFATSQTSVSNLIADLGTFATNTRKSLLDSEQQEVKNSIGYMFIESVENIPSIRAERNVDNSPNSNKSPPDLPHELATIPPRRLNEQLLEQSERL
jgi:hypothetical protein